MEASSQAWFHYVSKSFGQTSERQGVWQARGWEERGAGLLQDRLGQGVMAASFDQMESYITYFFCRSCFKAVSWSYMVLNSFY